MDLLVNLVNLVNLLVKLVVYVLFEKLMYKEKQHEKKFAFQAKGKVIWKKLEVMSVVSTDSLLSIVTEKAWSQVSHCKYWLDPLNSSFLASFMKKTGIIVVSVDISRVAQ